MTRAERAAALLAFLVPLGLFVLAISPNPGYWDTGEMQTVPYIFGIAHKTGFPLFVLCGFVFTHLFALGTVAWRMGVMSALCMAGACVCAFAVAREYRASPPVALLAALLFATLDVTWSRGGRAEVQAMSMLFASLAVVCAVRYRLRGERRDLLLMWGAFGCGLATHPVALLLTPAAAYVTLARIRELPAGTLLAALGCAALPLAAYLSILWRSADVVARHLEPSLVLGVPPGQPFWNYADPSSPGAFFAYFTKGYGLLSQTAASAASPHAYLDTAGRFCKIVVAQFGAVPLVAALFGLTPFARRAPLLAIALALCVLLPAVFVLNYLEADEERYFLEAFWLLSVLAAIGCERVAARGRLLPVVLMAALVAFELVRNARYLERHSDPAAAPFTRDVASFTAQRSVIVVEDWVYAAPLAYGMDVSGQLGGRILVYGLDCSPLYPLWMRQRDVYLIAEKPPVLAFPLDATLVSKRAGLYRIRNRSAAPAPGVSLADGARLCRYAER